MKNKKTVKILRTFAEDDIATLNYCLACSFKRKDVDTYNQTDLTRKRKKALNRAINVLERKHNYSAKNYRKQTRYCVKLNQIGKSSILI